MPGLFTDAGLQDQLDNATRNLGAAPTATPTEAFSAALNANQSQGRLDSQTANAYDFVQQHLDAFEAKTGEALRNPLAIPLVDPNAYAIRAQRMQVIRDKFDNYTATTGDNSLTFPSDDEIKQGAVGIARQALSRQEQLGEGAQAPFAGAAGVLGSFVGAATDPFNAAAIAAVPEGGLATKVLGSAATFGGQALATDLLTYGFKKQVDPSFGPGQIAADTAENAAGGAAFELGGIALGKVGGAIWRRLKGVAPEIADKVPLEVQDAGNVAERKADLDANNPFQGPAGEAAHNEALVKIESDIRAGRPPELPASAQDPSIATAGPDPDEINAHARATNPGLFDLTDKLEGQIADMRAKVGEVTGSVFEKDIPIERDLRVQLNELQQQRAAMGPEVNAARQQAEQFLQSHPEAAPPAAALPEPAPPVQTVVTAKQAYGDQATIDAAAAHPFKNINRMADALNEAAPAWKAMRDAAKRGDIPPTHDITPDMMGAIKALVQARDQGKTIGEVMNAGPEFHSDNAQRATRLFFDHETGKFLSKAQMTANLKSFADGLREGPKIEPKPIASAPVDDGIVRLTQDAVAPDALAKVASDPQVHSAMEAELNRSIEQGANRVPTFENGKAGLGFADKELFDLNNQIDAAKEIGACAAPATSEAA